MRVLFTTIPSSSHLQVMVPMAWALRTAGHEVVFASQPELTDDIVAAGLPAVPVGEAFAMEAVMVDGRPLDAADVGMEVHDLHAGNLTYDRLHGLFTAAAGLFLPMMSPEGMVDELVDFARHWRPDLVIWDQNSFAGPLAAAVAGAAHGRLMFGLDVMGWLRQSYVRMLDERPEGRRDDPFEDWMQPILDRYGLAYERDLAIGQFTLCPLPASVRLDGGVRYVPFRYIPYGGRAVVPDWLRRPPERRRVCITLGVTQRQLGQDWVPTAELLEAVADLDAEVVATLDAKQLETLPSVPDNVRAVDFVPLDALLPSCSAALHHGGGGTFLTMLAHGVPQVIVPNMLWDTPHKADAVTETGAGLRLDLDRYGGLSPDAVRDALRRMLDEPSFAAGAARLRDEVVGTPGPNQVVPVLEKIAAEHRRNA
ncbi:activator-dependent family glycosyltransferase [Actinomadura sp. WMMB 499]|uniref:activator-dependent family glycosyltransferase n=1 Tax=Actinomadura sp. WMMB 499 TaxID=1219491 RepID=UPI001246EBA9|nr:activator-dependent family glycosyltransferase [Actinomadura sp. WMMB 499]QFG24799.1 activator-dependent family glycosyltransferase [Actinomadura sp. WMMB 499]